MESGMEMEMETRMGRKMTAGTEAETETETATRAIRTGGVPWREKTRAGARATATETER